MKLWKEKDAKLKVWVHRADFTVKGKRYKPKAFTKEDLEKTIIQIKSAALKTKVGLPADVPAITLGELVAEHLKDFDYDVEYYRRGKVVLEMFRDVIGEDEPVEQLATADIRSFIRFRRSQNPKLQNSSINKDITYISKLFSSASEYFRELEDWSSPKLPWETESTKRKDRVIYEEEAQKLLDYLRDPNLHKGEKPDSPQVRGNYADLFELCMATAARWGEISQIQWDHVNLPAGELVLPKEITKTNEPRTIPLNSRAKQILASRPRTSKYVFPRRDGLAPMRYYYDYLAAICRKIGLPFGRDRGFVLHHTRHTSITRLLEAGVDIATVQLISGHSDRTVAMNYAHSSKARTREAVEKLVAKPPRK